MINDICKFYRIGSLFLRKAEYDAVNINIIILILVIGAEYIIFRNRDEQLRTGLEFIGAVAVRFDQAIIKQGDFC